jgi:hypothetical protein
VDLALQNGSEDFFDSFYLLEFSGFNCPPSIQMSFSRQTN